MVTTDARYNKIELIPTDFRALLIYQSYNNRNTRQSKVLLHLLYLGCLCLKELNLLKMKVIRGITPLPLPPQTVTQNSFQLLTLVVVQT